MREQLGIPDLRSPSNREIVALREYQQAVDVEIQRMVRERELRLWGLKPDGYCPPSQFF